MFLVNPYIYSNVSYLVDDYSPVVAYSTQKISSTVTNVIRLRRNTDNAEKDFTASEILDGTVVAWGAVSGGTYVVKLYNQGTGGSTYDLVQSTATNQPKFIANAGNLYLRNGFAMVFFNGVDNYMSVASTPFGQVSNSFFSVSSGLVTETVGTVFASDNSLDGMRMFQDTRTTPNRNLLITNTSSTLYAAGMSTARTAVNTLTLLSSFVDASKGMSAFDNGATGGTDTFTGTFNNTGIYLGRQGSFTYLGGEIAEFIGFATDEISSRTDIETNINDRLSIY
jgi:hypothetical protein